MWGIGFVGFVGFVGSVGFVVFVWFVVFVGFVGSVGFVGFVGLVRFVGFVVFRVWRFVGFRVQGDGQSRRLRVGTGKVQRLGSSLLVGIFYTPYLQESTQMDQQARWGGLGGTYSFSP